MLHRLKYFICKILGHVVVDINYVAMTARCQRCGALLNISYDMSYGETVITGET